MNLDPVVELAECKEMWYSEKQRADKLEFDLLDAKRQAFRQAAEMAFRAESDHAHPEARNACAQLGYAIEAISKEQT